MNWHQHPALRDRLAADYAIGTLRGGARRRFEAVLHAHPDVARAAARWDERLQPLNDALPMPSVPAGDALWARIAERSFGAGPAAAADAARPFAAPPRRRAAAGGTTAWWQRWLAPVPAAALALGLLLGLAAPLWRQAHQPDRSSGPQLPESYVGVLATAAGKPGLIVSSLRRGQTVDLKVLQRVPVPPGSQLVLWTLDAQGVAQAVGPLPAFTGNFVSLALAQPAEALFNRAVELAVSIEPPGPAPETPGSAFVYRGLCGKLWPVVPATAATAAASASAGAGPASR